PATADAIADVLAETAPRLQVYDTTRMAQYANAEVAADQICYLDDLFSDRYDRMLQAARRHRGIDINPLGNFAEHIPSALRPLADNRLGQTALLRLERTLMRRSEDRTAGRFRRCLLVNSGEAAELGRRTGVPGERIIAVPPLVATPPSPARQYDGQPEFVFLGDLGLPHNDDGLRWFLTAVWPALLSRLPRARLRVIGREARPGVLALAETLGPSVAVEGYVADLSAALEGSAGLVNPLRFGSGVKLKVIDALGRHLPVVSTAVGAEGIASGPGTGVLLADDPAAFVELLCALTDPTRNAELSDQAAGHFRRVYSRSAVFDHYDRAFSPG
nr:glycosyltransferase family 4 protein [Actinomycetes bacterium]